MPESHERPVEAPLSRRSLLPVASEAFLCPAVQAQHGRDGVQAGFLTCFCLQGRWSCACEVSFDDVSGKVYVSASWCELPCQESAGRGLPSFHRSLRGEQPVLKGLSLGLSGKGSSRRDLPVSRRQQVSHAQSIRKQLGNWSTSLACTLKFLTLARLTCVCGHDANSHSQKQAAAVAPEPGPGCLQADFGASGGMRVRLLMSTGTASFSVAGPTGIFNAEDASVCFDNFFQFSHNIVL